MPSAEKVPVAALRLLLQRGFDATSVDELAAAVGVSRSTFFRRYGSKEDMVFADLEERVAAARASLVAHRADGPLALVPAALSVFDHATMDAEPARARWELLHAVPSLRDRELVSTHRFERLFRDHLLSLTSRPAAPETPEPVRPDSGRTAAVALASAVVAVHNDHLRSWLRSPGDEVRAALATALRRLIEAWQADAGTTGSAVASGSVSTTTASADTVVVVTAAGDPVAVAAAVERALRERD